MFGLWIPRLQTLESRYDPDPTYLDLGPGSELFRILNSSTVVVDSDPRQVFFYIYFADQLVWIKPNLKNSYEYMGKLN